LLTELWRRPEVVCLLTAFDSAYQAIADLSLPRMQALCSAHGYVFRPARIDTSERPGGWLKIAPIRAALAGGFDWVVWFDIDALVLRTDEDLRLALRGGGDLLMSWHTPTDDGYGESFLPHFNTGVMAVRVCDWSRGFLARVWDTGQLVQPRGWADQAAVMHLLGYDDVLELGPRRQGAPDLAHVGRLSAAWNTIPGVAVHDDPIVHHWAGVGNFATRLRLMRIDAASIPFRESLKRSRRARYAQALHRLRNHADTADALENQILSIDPDLRARMLGGT
jgi:hypothetical protein